MKKAFPALTPEQRFRLIVDSPDQQQPNLNRINTQQRQWQVPRPLQYRPQDYVMVITMRSTDEYGDPSNLFGMGIPGEQMEEFFQTGKMDFRSPVASEPVRVYPSLVDADGELPDDCSDIIRSVDFEVKVTLVRIPDRRAINLLDWGTTLKVNRKPVQLNLTEWHLEKIEAYWEYVERPVPILNLDYGRALCAHCFAGEQVDFNNVEGGFNWPFARERPQPGRPYNLYQFYLEQNYHFRLKTLGGKGEDDNILSEIRISGYSLRAQFFNHLYADDYFHGREGGVSFAHFLEGLDDWFP
jgi:hypothetical protein